MARATVLLTLLLAAAALLAAALPAARAAELEAAAGRKVLGPLMAAPLVDGVREAPALVEVAGKNEEQEEEDGEDDGEEEEEEDSADEASAPEEENKGYLPAPATVAKGQGAAAGQDACGNEQDACEKAPARVVSRLSSQYRPYKDTETRPGEAASVRDMLPEEDREDHGDAVLRGLFSKLGDVETAMKKDRDWVKKVYALIDHYRGATQRVNLDLHRKGGAVYRLEKMIHARQHELANGKLKDKLKNVNAAMAELEGKTKEVEAHRSTMIETRAHLKQHILNLRHMLRDLGAPVYSR